MTTYAELLAEARAAVKEISLEELARRLRADAPPVLLDVREPDEVQRGFIAGALAIPRGILEREIEGKVPDKRSPIAIYCASGARSAFAARSLSQLGYENVVSVHPGFHRWRELGFPFELPTSLNATQRERYARHVLLPEVGERGQAKLLAGKVLLLGAGGLGSPAALYLAAAGVGTLGIVDHDVVDASNLQRQILHRTSAVGMPKVESAAQTLAELDPAVKVAPLRERLTKDNVDRIFGMGWDLVVDGTDNFPTRYLVSDASLVHQLPVIHGSVFRFDGAVTTFVPARAAERFGVPASGCYRCLHPKPPPAHLAPSCQEAGVLGILCGIIGTLQATEAIKLLLRQGDPLSGRLLTYDSLKTKFREIAMPKDPACAACGKSPRLQGYVDYEHFCDGGARPVTSTGE